VRSLIVTLFAVGALAAATPVSAQHQVFFFCTIEPFSYHVEDSAYQGHIGGRYTYSATGTTILTGPDCPMHGQTITIHERGEFLGVFEFTTVAVGHYDASADLNHGATGASLQGSVTLFGPTIFGPVSELVVVDRPGLSMTLDQLANIDLSNPHHRPLLSLETLSGSLSGVIVHHG